MEERTPKARFDALHYAGLHAAHDETPDQVVLRAKTYFAFLSGDEPEATGAASPPLRRAS